MFAGSSDRVGLLSPPLQADGYQVVEYFEYECWQYWHTAAECHQGSCPYFGDLHQTWWWNQCESWTYDYNAWCEANVVCQPAEQNPGTPTPHDPGSCVPQGGICGSTGACCSGLQCYTDTNLGNICAPM